MLAISIQQPWAWAIFNAGKDIENRDWMTDIRGKVLIHTGKKWDLSAVECLYEAFDIVVPVGLQTGGIIGTVDIIDCVQKSGSPWFFGKYGFVLSNPVSIDFFECNGKPGFFEVQILNK